MPTSHYVEDTSWGGSARGGGSALDGSVGFGVVSQLPSTKNRGFKSPNHQYKPLLGPPVVPFSLFLEPLLK